MFQFKRKKDLSAEHAFIAHVTLSKSADESVFDYFPSPQDLTARIHRLGQKRDEISPEELGTLAGAGVLTQYRAAKAETTIRWWKSPALALSTMYAMLTVGAPAIALGAGLSLDVAIFGGAASDLMKVNPLYQALAVGSLVFAVGIGISKNFSKVPLTGFMLAASLGASVLAADNDKFKEHFANMLPESMRAQTYVATADATAARASVDSWTKALDSDTYQLNHGGKNGLPILADGYSGNDAQGFQLQNITIPHDQDELRKANENLARLTAQQSQVSQESLSNWYGRLLGAAYLFLWLGASQLVVANVISHAPDLMRKQREKNARHGMKKSFVRDMESPKTMPSTATAAVGDMLMHFSDALADAAKGDAERQKSLGKSFQGEAFQRATQIGLDAVCNSLHPSIEWKEATASFLPRRVRDWWTKPGRSASHDGPTP